MIVRYLLLVLMLGFAVPAMGETYKWKDDRGTVNYTDDLGKVPPRYLKRVTVVGGAAEAAEPVVTEVKEDNKETDQSAKGKEKQEKPADSAAKGAEKKPTLYNGKSADTWRDEFDKLKADIKRTEDSLKDRQAQVGDTSKMTRAQYLGVQHEIKRLETKLATLQEKLEALNESAAKAGVPADAR